MENVWGTQGESEMCIWNMDLKAGEKRISPSSLNSVCTASEFEDPALLIKDLKVFSLGMIHGLRA